MFVWCHCGTYQVCSRICSASDKDPQLEKLFIRQNTCSNELSSHIFVDTGVYSRNRCFRLVSSSKAGKNSVLLPTRRFRSKNMVCTFLMNISFYKMRNNLDVNVMLHFPLIKFFWNQIYVRVFINPPSLLFNSLQILLSNWPLFFMADWQEPRIPKECSLLFSACAWNLTVPGPFSSDS